jgi:hypothetical protein
MVRVTLDEVRLNAIFAALHEREHRLAVELARLTRQPESKDREFAMDCVAMGIQHCYLARMELTAAIPEPELPEDATYFDLSLGDHHVGVGR